MWRWMVGVLHSIVDLTLICLEASKIIYSFTTYPIRYYFQRGLRIFSSVQFTSAQLR